MFVYGPDHHFQDQWLDAERCYLIFLHPVVSFSRSVSHATLVLAELIVCSTRGFACILAKWFWPAVMSLLHMEVPRPHVISEPTHTLEGEVLT